MHYKQHGALGVIVGSDSVNGSIHRKWSPSFFGVCIGARGARIDIVGYKSHDDLSRYGLHNDVGFSLRYIPAFRRFRSPISKRCLCQRYIGSNSPWHKFSPLSGK